MSLEPVTETRALHTVVHFQAEVRALASHSAADLRYWERLEAAQLACARAQRTKAELEPRL